MTSSSQHFFITNSPNRRYHFHTKLSLDSSIPIHRSTLPFSSATPGVSSFRSASNENLLPLDDSIHGLTKMTFKGLEMNNSLELAHRFRADLVDPNEQNRKLRLRIGQRWSEAGMQKR